MFFSLESQIPKLLSMFLHVRFTIERNDVQKDYDLPILKMIFYNDL